MKLEEWKYHRKWTLANFCVAAFAYGLSLTIYASTEFYYFRDTMKVSDPDTYYGLSWALLCGSGIISSLVGSFYADLTKKNREIFLWSNAINMVGNIMYLLYYSPVVVLLGQLLIGTAAARVVATTGEISRLYEADELTGKIAYIGFFTSFGVLTGPCTIHLFNLVDICVGSWVLNVNNMAGVVMGIFYLLQFWFNHFTLKNLSLEYNLKKMESDGLRLMQETHDEKVCKKKERRKEEAKKGELEEDYLVEKEEAEKNIVFKDELMFERAGEEEEEKEEEEGEEQAARKVASYLDSLSFKDKYLLALRTLLRSKEVLFLYSFNFFCSYARATIVLLWPIKAALYLKWQPTDMATFHIISNFSGAVPTALAVTLLAKYIEDVYLLGLTVFTLQLSLVCMTMFPLVIDNHLMAHFLMYASGVVVLISQMIYQIVTRSMLAKFVPENIQSVTEGIRNGLFELSYLIAGLCVKLPDTYFSEFMLVAAFMIPFAFSWCIVNAEKFKKIKVLEIDVSKHTSNLD